MKIEKAYVNARARKKMGQDGAYTLDSATLKLLVHPTKIAGKIGIPNGLRPF